MKRGRITNTELEYIKSNANTSSYLEIAKTLNREPSSVKGIIVKMGFKADLSPGTFNPVFITSVREQEFWPTIQAQFDENEQKTFEFQWNQMHEQFKDDVFPTEKLQIVDTIKLGLLMDRNLSDQQKSRLEIKNTEEALEHELSMPAVEQERDIIENLKGQLAMLRSAQGQLGKSFQDLLQRKNGMFESLKATREQRIKRVESSRENFTAWMNDIISNPDRRRELGLYMEKVRLAAINEEVRLAAYYKYEDGMLDQPLLTPDTVKGD